MKYADFYEYLRSEATRSPHTVASYASDLEQFRAFFKEDLGHCNDSPENITLADMRLWVSSLSSKGIARSSIARKVQSLRSFFAYLERYHGLRQNPARLLHAPRIPKVLPDYLRPGESANIINGMIATKNKEDFTEVRNTLIINMLYSTGIRAAEIIGLKDLNVDTNRCELKVLGKRNKERIIPFGTELQDMISEYRQIRQKETGGTEYFFVRPDGRPIYYGLLWRLVHSVLTDASVAAVKRSPHALRHSFATDMLNNGAELTAVKDLLGHSSLATTQRYTHLTYRELQQNYKLAHPRAQKTK